MCPRRPTVAPQARHVARATATLGHNATLGKRSAHGRKVSRYYGFLGTSGHCSREFYCRSFHQMPVDTTWTKSRSFAPSFSPPHIASSSPASICPYNCLAFQADRSDPCGDRAERGTQENDYDDVYD